MPLPAGLDPAQNVDPRKTKPPALKKQAANKAVPKGTKSKGGPAKNSDGKPPKGDPYAVEKHWINMALKSFCVLALFFTVRGLNLVSPSSREVTT